MGIGIGIGASADPQGQRPGGGSGANCGHGTTYGDFASVGGSIGPFQWNPIDTHGGYDTTTGKGYHDGLLNGHPGFGYGDSFSIDIGGAFGVEVVGH